MVPIGKWPILWHIMKIYSHYGHKDFILCLGYKGELIKEFFRNYLWHTSDATITLGRQGSLTFPYESEEVDWRVTMADTGENSMTAYRVRLIESYLGDDEQFLLTYGDGVGDVDIPAVIAQHQRQGRACTLSGVHPPGRFGELTVTQDGICTGFNEKPQTEEGYINGGFMACSRRLFEYLPDDPTIMLEEDPMDRLVADGQLSVYRHEGFWQPMDTLAEFRLLNRLWQTGQAPWKIW
jgi:glucose-1-phosphate cytidylyltransferase